MFYRPMLAVSVLAAALVTGCNNPASKLIGKWEADMSAVMADVQSQVEKSGNPLAGALAGMMSMVKLRPNSRPTAHVRSAAVCWATRTLPRGNGGI